MPADRHEPVRWGCLSTARIAVRQVLPAMQKGKLCRVEAIASRDLEKAKKSAGELNIPKAYASYEELLADPEIEAVYNPLPNHLHVEWSVKAAEAGKHVLCEKPVAMNAPEAETLLAARDRTGVLMQEAFMVRCHPQWRRARDLVRQGILGRVQTIQGLFSYDNFDPNNIRNIAGFGGGGIYDIGCYPIVTSRFIFGAEPTRVAALLDWDPNFQTDRLASVILDYPDGRQASFVCGTQITRYQRMHIFGDKGRVEIEIPFNAPNHAPCRIFFDDGGAAPSTASARAETFEVVDQYQIQGDEFSEAVRAGGPLEFPLEDAVQNMRVIDAVFRAAKSGAWEKVG